MGACDAVLEQADLLAQAFPPDAGVVLDPPRGHPSFLDDRLPLLPRVSEYSLHLPVGLEAELLREGVGFRACLATDVVTFLPCHRDDVLGSLLGRGEDRVDALADAAVVGLAFRRGGHFFGVYRPPTYRGGPT